MYFKMLGPLEVEDRGRRVEVVGAKQRTLLTILLLRANRVVTRDVLIDELWSERPPEGAAHALETHVSRLRKVLERQSGDVIVTRPTGYMLQLDGDELDVERFEQLAEAGRAAVRAGDYEEAVHALRRALSYWRGAPLDDVRFESFAQLEIRKLEERHATVLEALFEAELALGRHADIVDELEALARGHPLRELLQAQLMLAFYRCGRQAEALEVYRRARRELVEELGIEPSAELRDLEQRVLRHDPALLPDAGLTPAAPAPPHRRRSSRGLLFGAALAAVVIVASIVAALLPRSGSTSSPVIPVDAAGSFGVLDAHSAKLSGRPVQLPASPAGMAFGGGYVWVSQPSDRRVRQIDPTTGTVHQAIGVGNDPSGIAYGAKALWIANTLDGTVDRIDAATFERVSRIAVGGSPTAIAYHAPFIWVANSSTSTLTRLDSRGGPKHVFPVDADPTAVAVGDGAVWVTTGTGAGVLRLDPRTGTLVKRIPVGNGPVALAVSNGAVWVANEADGTVSRIDTARNSVTSTFSVQADPSSLAIAAGSLWVGSASSGSIWRVDPNHPERSKTIRLGGSGITLTTAGGNLYFVAEGRGRAHRGGTLTSLHNPSCFAPSGVALLDPGTGSCPSISTLVYDGLVSYARAGSAATELVPDLATAMPTVSDNGRAFTFELRRGLRYSTGARVRVGDIRRALERSYRLQGPAAFPALGAELVGGTACLKETTRCDLRRGVAVDEAANTITFHLVAPDGDFPYRLVYTTIPVPPGTPVKEIDGHPPPGTGPYGVETNTSHQLTLVRNPAFRSWSFLARPTVYPDVIVVRRAGGVAGVAAVEHKRADLVEVPLYDISPSALRTIETEYRSQARPDRLSSTTWLILNSKRPPFDDVRVRRALSFAVDRRRLVSLAGGRLAARATCQILPPGFQGYERYCPYTRNSRPHGPWRAPNLATARALVAASGTRGDRVAVWSERIFGITPVLRYVTSLLNELGYRAELKVVSPNALGAAIATPRSPVSLTLFYAPAFRPNASFFFNDAWFCTDLNGARYGFACTSRIRSLVARANTAESRDPVGASKLWAKIDRIVVDQAAIVPLYNGRFFDLVSSRVGNYGENFSGALRDQMWVR